MQMADEIPEGPVKIWRVVAQKANEVPEGSGTWLMKFRRIPVQIANKMPEGSNTDDL